ncbi:MAG: PKD domain-containing protein [bacterium]|nr:PKD domain-containing protein [bacterium]
MSQTDEFIIWVTEGRSENSVARELMASGVFEYAEPDWRLFPIASPRQSLDDAHKPRRSGSTSSDRRTVAPPINCPDDPLLMQQWHHQADRLHSCRGWSIHTGTPTVTVGICDTGIRTTHEDLQLHRLEAYNAVNRLWESQGGSIGPVHPHGTMTTGTAAANGDNGLGVVGVGWDLSHRMLRVSNAASGSAQLSDLQHAVRVSIESGDRVASVSYSGVANSSNLTTATYVKSIGGLMVWAAGNNSANLNFGDRDADDLIVVGATNSADARASFSAYGPFVDLFAPGVGVLTTDAGSDTDYAAVDGTSFACPLAAGLCATIWSVAPGLTPDEVESALKLGSDDIGAMGVDSIFGYGRINVPGSLQRVANVPPTAGFEGLPMSGTSPLTVAFLDQSTGIPTSWSWGFGDGGTSALREPNHTYATSGIYTVTLTVTNAYGTDTQTRIDYIGVDFVPPVADFTGMPTTGSSPLTVDFLDGSSGGAPTSWLWDFGDGATSTAQNPTHTYSASGFYSVVMTAGNAYGSDTLTRTNYVAVDVSSPTADFSADPTLGAKPLTVSFTDLSTGIPSLWTWDFGDGATSSSATPSHTYSFAGDYTVSLTVTNPFGSDTHTIIDYIEVRNSPLPQADFVGAPTSGQAPLTVDFTDLSTGYITEWRWQFDDGTESTAQHPSHTFTSPGLYSINLTVTNPEDCDEVEFEDYILVTP